MSRLASETSEGSCGTKANNGRHGEAILRKVAWFVHNSERTVQIWKGHSIRRGLPRPVLEKVKQKYAEGIVKAEVPETAVQTVLTFFVHFLYHIFSAGGYSFR